MIRKTIKAGLFRFLTLFEMTWREKTRPGANQLFLTFDDGPHPQFTPEILEILNTHHVKATFFLVGERCRQYGDIVSRIVSEGHTIGNHSLDHTDLKQASWSEIKKQIETTDRILSHYCHDSLPCIRPPKGDWGIKYLYYAITRRRKTVFWSVDPRDFECATGEEVLRRLDFGALKDGDIMLLHDKSGATADAVRSIVPELLDRGFSLHRLPQY